MAKVKLNNWNGIYTNKDENDPINEYEIIDPQQPPFDVVRDSCNVRHDWGFLTFEPRNLASYMLPDCNAYTGDAPGTWSWEDGLYAIVTNDKLSATPVPAEYNILILVAKRTRMVGSTPWYDRLIWMQNQSDPALTWVELSNYGDGNLPIINGIAGAPMDFTTSVLSTTVDGKVKLTAANGIVKIYLPHDCFWFGRLERTLYESYLATTTFNEFYFDRLVEPFSSSNLGVIYDPMVILGITLPNPASPEVASGRRLGISIFPAVVDTQALITDQVAMDMSYQGTVTLDVIGFGKPTAYVYKFTNHVTGEIITAPFDPTITYPTTGTLADPLHQNAYFYETSSAGTLIVSAYMYDGLGGGYTEFMRFQDGTTFATKFGPTTNGVTLSDGSVVSTTGGYYQIAKTTLDADTDNSTTAKSLNYLGSQLVSVIGFKNTINRVDMVVTAVLDEQEEIIIATWGQDVKTTQPTFVIQLSSSYPARNSNSRITRIRYYLKVTGDTDYGLVKDVNFLDPLQKDPRDFYISDTGLTSKTGTLLSQNIGFLFDPKVPDKYSIITNIKDIATVDGVSIAMTNSDYTNVYYSVVGGGVLQSNLLYTENLLQLTADSAVTAVMPLNTNFGVATITGTHVIKASNDAGVLAFTVIGSNEHGVKNRDDVAFKKDGSVVLNTQNGIIMTNGNSEAWESKPINDICEANYATSKIGYNQVRHEINYIPGGSINGYFRFRLDRAIILMFGRKIPIWERIDPGYTTDPMYKLFEISDVQRILTDIPGNNAYLTKTQLFVNQIEPTNYMMASVTNNASDLGDASLDKLINFYDVDYIGSGTVSVTTDTGTSLEAVLPLRTTRGVNRIYHPHDLRQPCEKIRIGFVTSDATFRLYGVEVNFGTVKRRVIYG